MIWLYAILIWMGMAVVAVANGIFRVRVLHRRLGRYLAHVVSSAMLSAAIVLIGWGTAWVLSLDAAGAWQVGWLWLAATVLFEFGAGHYVFRQPWHRLLADYNILAGRVWVVVLATTLLAPRLGVYLLSGR